MKMMKIYFDHDSKGKELSYITFYDLYQSYNEMLSNQGGNFLSMKFFIDQFISHSILNENNLHVKRSARVLKNIIGQFFIHLMMIHIYPRKLGLMFHI